MQVMFRANTCLWHVSPDTVSLLIAVSCLLTISLHLLQLSSFLCTRHVEAGTVAYMAPECFMPGAQVNEKSDIYGLGVILWQCVTGEQPWHEYRLNHYALVVEVSTGLSMSNTSRRATRIAWILPSVSPCSAFIMSLVYWWEVGVVCIIRVIFISCKVNT